MECFNILPVKVCSCVVVAALVVAVVVHVLVLLDSHDLSIFAVGSGYVYRP